MSAGRHGPAVLPPPTMENLGGGFHAFVQWDGSWGLNNAGDLVFNGGNPFVVMGSTQGLAEALIELQRLDATTVVPGHGAVCDPDVIVGSCPTCGSCRSRRETAMPPATVPPSSPAERTSAPCGPGPTRSGWSATSTAPAPSSAANPGGSHWTTSSSSGRWSASTPAGR